jgi:CRISPR-associated protein Cas1
MDFKGRMTMSHQNNASDPFNVALNYGYGFLEAECRMAINSVGLEPAVGFLHEFSNYQTKASLAYDLQEPFRWLVDLSVVHAFESDVLDLHDFYFTGDDYRYRFEPEAKQRFIGLLRDRFNAGVEYKGRVLKWDTVIEQKTNELGRFLIGRSQSIEFLEPSPKLERTDNRALRNTILNNSG